MSLFLPEPNPITVEDVCNEIISNEKSDLKLDIAYLCEDTRMQQKERLTEQDVHNLVEALEQNTSITSVTLKNTYFRPTFPLTSKYAKWPLNLIRTIGKLPSLKEIIVQDSKLFENEVRHLFSGLNDRTKLRTFKVGFSVAFDSKETYALLIQLLSQQSKLHHLELRRASHMERHNTFLAIPLKELGWAIPSWHSITVLAYVFEGHIFLPMHLMSLLVYYRITMFWNMHTRSDAILRMRAEEVPFITTRVSIELEED